MTTLPRRFHLWRTRDITGSSGTGRVADGVLWPDGTVTIRWRGTRPSTVHWGWLADAEAVHGHGGHARIVWDDDPEPSDDGQQTADAAVRGVQAYMALDLHQALRRPVDHAHDAHHQGYASWADWWADLIGEVRARSDDDFLRAADPDTPTP